MPSGIKDKSEGFVSGRTSSFVAGGGWKVRVSSHRYQNQVYQCLIRVIRGLQIVGCCF
jgi:hypothetical protein